MITGGKNCIRKSSLKVRKLESWKVGKLESWKVRKLESWKVGKLRRLRKVIFLAFTPKSPEGDFRRVLIFRFFT